MAESKAAVWAFDQSVVSGTSDGIFSPGWSITREQCATMLYAFAIKSGRDVSDLADISLYNGDENGEHKVITLYGFTDTAFLTAIGLGTADAHHTVFSVLVEDFNCSVVIAVNSCNNTILDANAIQFREELIHFFVESPDTGFISGLKYEVTYGVLAAAFECVQDLGNTQPDITAATFEEEILVAKIVIVIPQIDKIVVTKLIEREIKTHINYSIRHIKPPLDLFLYRKEIA